MKKLINKTKLACNVGRTKRYLDEGLSVQDIAKKLKVTDDNVRGYIDIIKKAEENRKAAQ